MNLHSLARSCPASRALLVKRIKGRRWSPEEAAAALGVSERTVFKWLARYRVGGVTALMDRSSRPHQVPSRLPKDWEDLVIELRRCRLTGPAIARRLGLARARVARVLKRNGLGRLSALDPREDERRYQRRKPGSLVHLDVKKLGKIARPGHRVHGDQSKRVRGVGWEYVHVCVDDATRLAYVEVLSDERGATTAGFLHRAAMWFSRHGIELKQVMTDNGGGYLSAFFRFASKQLRLRHIRTRPYRPRTNGKAERFIQTMLREWAYFMPYAHSAQRTAVLAHWLSYYNHERPHGALKGLAPMDRLKAIQVNNLVRLDN
jgi:transposase InsO family protein